MKAFSAIARGFSSATIQPKVCIVGSGPAGFYAAQHIVKHLPEAQIDIYERLPVPFGLVRFGVAPDHPEVKNVINTFTKTAEHPNVQFLGNVNVGRDVRLKQLREAYHAVLLTYGADENRKLEIPGENLVNVHSARNIVGWYNGIPSDKDLKLDLSGSTAAIFGQGNVAIDVARILLTPIDILKKTDITQHALEQLASSKLKRVHLIGRRGPLQAAFTIKELREMLKLQNCRTCWRHEDFTGVAEVVPSLARPKKRIAELMLKSLKEPSEGDKEFHVEFHKSPLEFKGETKVTSVKLAMNTLVGDDILTATAKQTGLSETLDCDLAITSIGYKSVPIDDDFPFDEKKGIVTNSNFKVAPGLYASGWVATGPLGVILTTMNSAFVTGELIVKEIRCENNAESKSGFEGVSPILREKGVQIVRWSDWLKIDKFEQASGEKVGKPREKIVCVQEMLKVAS